MSHLLLATAWTAWAENAREQRRITRIAHNAVQRMRLASAAAALARWCVRTQVAVRRARLEACGSGRAFRRWGGRALRAWVKVAEEGRASRFAVAVGLLIATGCSIQRLIAALGTAWDQVIPPSPPPRRRRRTETWVGLRGGRRADGLPRQRRDNVLVGWVEGFSGH